MKLSLWLCLIWIGLNCSLVVDGQEVNKPSRWVDPETRRQRLITVSPETTVIVEPLDEIGFPDYVAALNERGKGIKPEENAAVDLCRILGFTKEAYRNMTDEERQRYAERFCEFMKVNRAQTSLLDESYPAYVKKLAGSMTDISNEKRSKFRDRLMAHYDPLTSWERDDCRELYDWMSRPATQQAIAALQHMVSNKKKFFWPFIPLLENEKVIRIEDCGSTYIPLFRDAKGLLRTSAMLDLGKGRFKEAAAKLESLHRLANMLSQQPLLFDQTFAKGIHDSAYRADAAFAQHREVPLEFIEDYQIRLRSLTPELRFRKSILDCERLNQLEKVCHLARRRMFGSLDLRADIDQLNGDAITGMRTYSGQRIEFPWYLSRFAELEISFDATMLELSRRYAEIENLQDLRMTERLKKTDELSHLHQREAVFLSRWDNVIWYLVGGPRYRGKILAGILAGEDMPSVSRDLTNDDLLLMKSELIDVLFSIERYRRIEGKYPGAINELLPRYLTSVPEDRFTEEDLVYEVYDNEFRLYSFGNLPGREGTEWSTVVVHSAEWEE